MPRRQAAVPSGTRAEIPPARIFRMPDPRRRRAPARQGSARAATAPQRPSRAGRRCGLQQPCRQGQRGARHDQRDVLDQAGAAGGTAQFPPGGAVVATSFASVPLPPGAKATSVPPGGLLVLRAVPPGSAAEGLVRRPGGGPAAGRRGDRRRWQRQGRVRHARPHIPRGPGRRQGVLHRRRLQRPDRVDRRGMRGRRRFQGRPAPKRHGQVPDRLGRRQGHGHLHAPPGPVRHRRVRKWRPAARAPHVLGGHRVAEPGHRRRGARRPLRSGRADADQLRLGAVCAGWNRCDSVAGGPRRRRLAGRRITDPGGPRERDGRGQGIERPCRARLRVHSGRRNRGVRGWHGGRLRGRRRRGRPWREGSEAATPHRCGSG